ncbi:MAG TPA: ABC transporter ATP-binding protein [Stellaceae bacterium]|jgi:branched-chain amino acid transport system ATP-binding protein|nr:ABC transporter ATP-binding protein [Stellaceae bacterium]
MLDVDHISAGYGAVAVLHDLSFAVAKGQAVAILGANGAGKTTLLKTICGLVPARAGAITFDGTAVARLATYEIARRGAVMVPEGRQILGPLTVAENLRLGHRAAIRRGGVLREDMEQVFALFPILAERSNQVAGQLSGGQQQMLAIGRALMGRPRLLLLDEPSLGLGPSIVAQVFETLQRIRQSGLTMLLVEQNAKRALDATDYAYVMERGRIVHQGPSRQLQSDPVVIEHYLGQIAH